jgi:hypothetical protein
VPTANTGSSAAPGIRAIAILRPLGARLGEERPAFTSLEVLCIDERRRIWWADHRIQWQRIRHPFIAIGNGGDFALGALAAGESAREAVRIASRLSASCGFGVDVVRF